MTAAEVTGDAELLLAIPGALRAMAANAERAVEASSAGRVAELERQIRDQGRAAERANDLIRELRRQMTALERQLRAADGWEWGVRVNGEIKGYDSEDDAVSARDNWACDVPEFNPTLVRRRVQSGFWLDVTP